MIATFQPEKQHPYFDDSGERNRIEDMRVRSVLEVDRKNSSRDSMLVKSVVEKWEWDEVKETLVGNERAGEL